MIPRPLVRAPGRGVIDSETARGGVDLAEGHEFRMGHVESGTLVGPSLWAWAPTSQVSSLRSRASPSRLRGLCAGCCFVSPSLPPEQISASGSFHRVAFPTRPSVFFQFAFTLWIIVFFRLFLRVMTWFMPVLPLQPVSSTRTEIMSFLFLCPQSLEHSERGQVWVGSGYWVSSCGCCLGPGGVHEGGGQSRV